MKKAAFILITNFILILTSSLVFADASQEDTSLIAFVNAPFNAASETISTTSFIVEVKNNGAEDLTGITTTSVIISPAGTTCTDKLTSDSVGTTPTTFIASGSSAFITCTYGAALTSGTVISADLQISYLRPGSILPMTSTGRIHWVIGEEINSEGAPIKINLNFTKEFNDKGEEKIKVKSQNGSDMEIKIMPDTASQIALEQLKIKVCSISNNCTIELKNVGNKNEDTQSYEIQIERHFKILGIFSTKANVKADVDAQTGKIELHKPWWAFISTEPSE